MLVIIVKYENVLGRYMTGNRKDKMVSIGAWARLLSPPVTAEGKQCLSWRVYRIGQNSGSLLVYNWNSTKRNSLLFEVYGNQIIGE